MRFQEKNDSHKGIAYGNLSTLGYSFTEIISNFVIINALYNE